MTTDIFFIILIVINASACYFLLSALKAIHKKFNNDELQRVAETGAEIKTYSNVLLYSVPVISIIYILYSYSLQQGWDAHFLDWMNLTVRWAHVVLGISWIGASFYFIFLENSLNRSDGLRDELAGNLWAIHGGGFYYIEKYKNAPQSIPKSLHWFKYEAYFTWLSGMLLLTLVYYMNAKAVMVDPAVSDIRPLSAIIIGIGTLTAGWFIYDLMCRSSLLQKKKLFAVIGFCILTLISYFLSYFLSGRAAFMHVGALLGTLMAGNVFFVIIPSQKALVKAAREGKPVDPTLGKYAGLRSLHNNYLTLPVIFVMISNHFPITYGTKYNWIILAVLTLGSVAVRHYINMHEKGIRSSYMLPFAVVALVALVFVTRPATLNKMNSAPVSFAEVQPLIQKRCVNCHSRNPVDDVNKIAPNGIMFDTPEEIKSHAERILVRAVQTKTMPQANKTGMSDEERELLGRWITQGAKLN